MIFSLNINESKFVSKKLCHELIRGVYLITRLQFAGNDPSIAEADVGMDNSRAYYSKGYDTL